MACKRMNLHPRDNEKHLLPHKVEISGRQFHEQEKAIWAWINSDEAQGSYFSFNTLFENWAIRFTHADTAFAFKMRFG